ncbi:MAG: FtsQ-type POTRA domain-containing protein [Patescibacteria group bacterium]
MRTIKRTEPEKNLSFVPLSRILFVIFIILIIYFLFYYNYFQIKKIVVINSKITHDYEIEENVFSTLSTNRFYIFPGKNIFLINKQQIATNLKNRFSNINDVSVSRIYPDVLKIKIQEKLPKIIWQTEKSLTYFVDANGEIFLEVSGISGNGNETNLPKIKDLSDKSVVLFENVLFPKHINFILKLNERLPQEGIKISFFEIPAKLAGEIHLVTDEGWKIYFNIEKDAEAQISNLRLALTDEIKERKINLDYIDLRIENWVYYKMRTGPQILQQSLNVEKEKKATE